MSLEGRRSTIRLMLGDCLERMKEIDDGYFKIAEQRIMETEPPIF